MGRPVFEEDANSPLLIGPLAILQVVLLGFANSLPKERLVSCNNSRIAWIEAAALLVSLGNVALGVLLILEEGPHENDDSNYGETLQVAVALTPTIMTAASVPVLVHLLHGRQLQSSVWSPRDFLWGFIGIFCCFRRCHGGKNIERGVVRTIRKRRFIFSGDNYGLGFFVYNIFSWPQLVCIIWISMTVAYSFYSAMYWDQTGGTFNIAGIIAVAANILLPTWNKSQQGDGSDRAAGFQSDTRGESAEVNIVGNGAVQNVVEIHSSKHKPKSAKCCFAMSRCGRRVDRLDEEQGSIQGLRQSHLPPPNDLIKGCGRHRSIANAHAAVTDYRPVLAVGDGSTRRASTVVEMTEMINESVGRFISSVRGVYSVATKGEASLRNLSVLLGTIAEQDAWVGQRCQRRRLLAAAHAQIWLFNTLTFHGADPNRPRQGLHSADGCRCLLHRWTNNSDAVLKPSPREEAEFLLGSPEALPEMATPQLTGAQYGNSNEGETAEDFFRRVWDCLSASPHKSFRPALLYFYVLAMQSVAGLNFASEADYFPSFDWVGCPYTEDDFAVGCVFSIADGKPGPGAAGKPQLATIAERSLGREDLCAEIQSQTVYNDKEKTGDSTKSVQRAEAPPTSKAMVHMAIRIMYRATMAQIAVWSLRSIRSILVSS